MSDKEPPQANSKKVSRHKMQPVDPPSGRLQTTQLSHDSLPPPHTETRTTVASESPHSFNFTVPPLRRTPMSDRHVMTGFGGDALLDYIPPMYPSQSLLSISANAYNPLQARVSMSVDDREEEALRVTKNDVMRKVEKLKQMKEQKYSLKRLSSTQSVVPKRSAKTAADDLQYFPLSALATHYFQSGETESVTRALLNGVEQDEGMTQGQKLESVGQLQPTLRFPKIESRKVSDEDDNEEDERNERERGVPQSMPWDHDRLPDIQRVARRDEHSDTREDGDEDVFIDTESDEETGREKDERTEFLENKAEYLEKLLPYYHKYSIKDVPVEERHKKEGSKRLDFARICPNWTIPYVLSGGVNRYITVHNYYTGALVGRLSNTDSTDGAWSQCGEYFIVCGEDSVKIAELRAESRQPNIVREFRTESAPIGASFGIKHNTAVIVLKSGTIHVYDDRLGDSEPVMTALGLPEITCIDTNPEDWRVMAIGFKIGAVKELNVLEPHKQSGQQTAYYQYFADGMEGSVFGCFLDEKSNRGRDDSEVKSVRYCVSPDSRYYNDIVVTKANGRTKWNAGGDSAYKFSPGKKRSVIAYRPPAGFNLSSATLAFNFKNDKAEDYVVAGTEEGVIVAYDAQSGKVIKYGTTQVEDVTLPDVETDYLPTSYVPIRKDQDESSFDPQPATRITAIDSIPDIRLGSFVVGGYGTNPTIDVFRFQEEDDDIDESLFHL